MLHSPITPKTALLLTVVCLTGLGLGAPGPAAAEPLSSFNLLLPWFEVSLDPADGSTTLFAVCNSSDEPVDVRITVHTNWGIPVLQVVRTLGADEVATVNLRDWLLDGRLPDRVLTAEELAHLRAALSGRPSPQDGQWYGSEVAPDRAAGYITFHVVGPLSDSLWGDAFLMDPAAGRFQGERLIDIHSDKLDTTCRRHGIRFLAGDALEQGTELIVWTAEQWTPSPTPEPHVTSWLKGQAIAYDEPGHLLIVRELSMLPVQRVRVSELDLGESFGWLDVRTVKRSLISARVTASAPPASLALFSSCLFEEPWLDDQSPLVLTLTINGERVDAPPGPSIPMGQQIHLEMEVTNGGTRPLSGIVVVDEFDAPVSCPRDTLNPGQSMLCVEEERSGICQNHETRIIRATTPDGEEVSINATTYYKGEHHAALDLLFTSNGQDADEPPGDLIGTWHYDSYHHFGYQVTNTGDVPLTKLVVTDSKWGEICRHEGPLASGEDFICWRNFILHPIPWGAHYSQLGTVVGAPPCGSAVSASDPVYYYYPSCPFPWPWPWPWPCL
jgi:hypothetical protein